MFHATRYVEYINVTEEDLQQFGYPQWISLFEVITLLLGLTLVFFYKPTYYGYWIFYQISVFLPPLWFTLYLKPLFVNSDDILVANKYADLNLFATVYIVLYGLCFTATIRFLTAPGIFMKPKIGRKYYPGTLIELKTNPLDTSFRIKWHLLFFMTPWILLSVVFLFYQLHNPDEPGKAVDSMDFIFKLPFIMEELHVFVSTPEHMRNILYYKCNIWCRIILLLVYITVIMVMLFYFVALCIHSMLEEFYYVVYLVVFPFFCYTVVWGAYIPMTMRPEPAVFGDIIMAIHGLAPLPMTIFLIYYIHLEQENAKLLSEIEI